MGANYCSLAFKGDLTKEEVREQFDSAVNESRYESGHCYSGEIGMATGLKFTGREFPTLEEAENYVEDTAEKWEEALCVRYTDKDGVAWWYIGAWCSS